MSKILGRAEQVALPEFNVSGLPAKVDTGAYSSSVDCESFEIVKHGGEDRLEFILLRPERVGYTGEKMSTTNFETTEIRNANGTQERFMLLTDLVVRGIRVHGRLTLANRAPLRYPVLLGRQFIYEAGGVVDIRQGQGLPGDEENL